MFRIQRYHRGGPVPAQSHLLFLHPSAYRRLGSGTSLAVRALRTVPPVEISSTPRSETPLARSTSYASLDRSFARAPCVPSHQSRSARPPPRDSSRQINKLCVVRPFVCANCVRVYRYTIERVYARAYINANAVSYVRLRACLRAELIKTQNAFARKIFQHANALWVQKLSRCTILCLVYMYCSYQISGGGEGNMSGRDILGSPLCIKPWCVS